jgi:YVTN family beta-propeller protein
MRLRCSALIFSVMTLCLCGSPVGAQQTNMTMSCSPVACVPVTGGLTTSSDPIFTISNSGLTGLSGASPSGIVALGVLLPEPTQLSSWTLRSGAVSTPSGTGVPGYTSGNVFPLFGFTTGESIDFSTFHALSQLVGTNPLSYNAFSFGIATIHTSGISAGPITFTGFNGASNFPVGTIFFPYLIDSNQSNKVVNMGPIAIVSASPGPFAYVGSSTGVSVFDASTFLPITTIPISGGVTELTSSPDGSAVYGTNRSSGVVTFIDTKSNTVAATVPAGSAPYGAAVTPDGSKLYVADVGGSVTVIDIASKSILATIPSPTTGPTNLVISPDGKTVYVTHDPFPAGSPNAITKIDTATNTVTGSISGVGTFGFGIAISPDGKTLYVSSDTVGLQYVDIATSTITKTVPIPGGPGAWYISVSPDGSTAYVGGYGLGLTAIIDLNSGTPITTVPVGTFPFQSAVTPDGASVWQANSNATTFTSIISTASNTVVDTIPVTNDLQDGGVAIPSAPPTSQSITQPLSPTAPNIFNFGPHTFTVQYPPGTSFSGVNMTVVAAQVTQQTFKQRVAGTTFANATCIVYSGAGGNCVDYKVTCSNSSGSSISCPSVSTPSIDVKTAFDTLQSITNPGFLSAPIGTNEWQNIFTAFYFPKVDATIKGHTNGFSEFFAVDLGATNGEGAGKLQFLSPLQQNDPRVFPAGTSIPVQFQLTSVANPSQAVTDAIAGISVVMISDANGNSVSNVVLQQPAAFEHQGSSYLYSLNTTGYAPGVYNLTVYGNAFVAQQVQFTLPAPTSGVHLVTIVQSLTLNSNTNQYIAVFKVTNSGNNPANGVIVTASKLNSTLTSTALPISLGDIGSGASTIVTLAYPISAGAAGSLGALTISESYAGGSGGGGTRVTLP